jgi:hypothetical protein
MQQKQERHSCPCECHGDVGEKRGIVHLIDNLSFTGGEWPANSV